MGDPKKMKPTVMARFFAAASLVLVASSGFANSSNSSQQLIDSTREIRALDARLNVLYKQALRNNPMSEDLRTEQRKWLVEVQNKCPDPQCLIAQYTSRNQQLRSRSTVPKACSIHESELLSNWQRVKGGFFQEFMLERSAETRSFASWMHHRPELMGTWSLNGCVLTITDSHNPKLSFEYEIVGYAKHQLRLQDADGGAYVVYRKFK